MLNLWSWQEAIITDELSQLAIAVRRTERLPICFAGPISKQAERTLRSAVAELLVPAKIRLASPKWLQATPRRVIGHQQTILPVICWARQLSAPAGPGSRGLLHHHRPPNCQAQTANALIAVPSLWLAGKSDPPNWQKVI